MTHPDEPCIAQEIWGRAKAKWPTPPRRAQDRAALIRFLHDETRKVSDKMVRAHVAEILRHESQAYLEWIKPVNVWNYLASLDRRLTNIEAHLHRESRKKAPQEITSIRDSDR